LPNELIETLTNIKSIELMKSILENMTSQDILRLLDLLEYTDNDTKSRWLHAYNELMKLK
jgi:hypothetical protein